MMKPRRLSILFLAVTSNLYCASVQALPPTSEWLSPVSGLWTDGAKWSTDPVYPDNGQPNVSDIYSVVIDVAGTPYTVSLFESVNVSDVNINSADATLALGNSRLETSTINLVSGQLLLGIETPGFSGLEAEVVGSTITGDGSLVIYSNRRGATVVFDAVTLGVDVVVPSTSGSPADNRLSLRNGLTLLEDTQLELLGLVDVEGSQSIQGSGEVVLNSGIRFQSNSTLTIGPDVTVRSLLGGVIGFTTSFSPSNVRLINEGVIIAEAPDRDVRILERGFSDQPVFENQGIVEVKGTSRLRIDGDWTNNGTIRVRDQGTLWLAGEYQWSDLGNLDRQGGKVHVGGIVENNGSTIEANSVTGSLVLGRISGVQTSIRGGTIAATDGQTWELGESELVNVTIATDMTSSNIGAIDIVGDLTLDQATITLDHGEPWLRWQGGSQSLLGQGTVRFESGRPSRVSFGAQLTISDGIVLDAATEGSDNVRVQGDSLINHGTMLVRPGATMHLAVDDFTNHGTISIDGRATIGGAANDTWRNEGIINLKPGSRFDMRGTFGLEDLGTIVDEGATVDLYGIFDLKGGTLDFEALPFANNLRLFGGTFRNGRLTSSGDATIDFVQVQFAAFLENVTLATDLFIPGGAPAAGVRVTNGLTLEDSTITMPEGAGLTFGGSNQVLQGTGVIFAPNRLGTSATTTIAGDDLIIGENIVIRNGNEAFRELRLGFAENRGTIIAEAPNTLVTIGEFASPSVGSQWTNNGTILAQNGTVEFRGNYSVDNLGDLQNPSGRVVLNGNIANQGKTFSFPSNSGLWVIDGEMIGGVVEAGEGVVVELGGLFDSVTLRGHGESRSGSRGTGSSFMVRNQFTLDDALLVVKSGDEFNASGSNPVLFDGTGVIRLDGSPTNTGLGLATQITIGAGVTVETGTIGSGSIEAETVINHGTILAQTIGQTLVVQGDLLSPGTLAAKSGSMHINGSIEFAAESSVVLELFKNSPSVISATGPIQLAGNILVEVEKPVALSVGDKFTILRSNLMNGLIGQFSNVESDVLSGYVVFRIDYAPQAVTLTVTRIPEPNAAYSLLVAACGMTFMRRRRCRTGKRV